MLLGPSVTRSSSPTSTLRFVNPLTVRLWMILLCSIPCVGVLAAEKPTAVIRAGGELSSKISEQLKLGLAKNKDERRTFVSYEDINVLPKDALIAATVRGKNMKIEASRDAVGKNYNVVCSLKVKIQRLQRRNRRDVWVTVGHEVVQHPFKLVVDYPEWPELTMTAGQEFTMAAPPGIQFVEARPKQKRRLQTRCNPGHLSLMAKSKGKSKLAITYEIAAKKIKREFRVVVKADPILVSVTAPVGAATRVPLGELEEQLRIRNAEIIEWSIDPSVTGFTLENSDRHGVVARGVSSGIQQAMLLLQGVPDKRSVKPPQRFVVLLEVTVPGVTAEGEGQQTP